MTPLEMSDDEFPKVTQQRVIIVSRTAASVSAALTAQGMSVEVVAPDGLRRSIERQRPNLILVGESVEGEAGSGRQLALSLRAAGRTFSIPVVGVLPLVNVPTVFRWLEVGAVDVWSDASLSDFGRRATQLIHECESRGVHTDELPSRLLAFMRRNSMSGTALVYVGTPFEGAATFVDGHLIECRLGPLEGTVALEQLLSLDAEAISWVDAKIITQPMAAVAAPFSTARISKVLLVEDIETIALLVKKTLISAGYQVDVAGDGREGLQAALKQSYDVIIADLNLPLLDGWGMMRELRDDPIARETAVMVLSAHDELVDTLKVARAGARAYLKKSGRSKELLDTLGLLCRPRSLAWQSLTNKRQTTVDLRTVGGVWFARALAELDCMGRLLAEDELTRLEVQLCQGQLVFAVAQVGSRRVEGERALEALLSVRGPATFEPMAIEVPASAPWLFDVVQKACDAVAVQSRRALDELIRYPAALQLNRELAQVFANVASAKHLAVLDALSRGVVGFAALIGDVGQDEDDVKSALAELVRRGVLAREA